MSAYLIVDPIGDYALRLKAFLDRLELPAIAVFSSRPRMGAWQYKWRKRMGEHVVGEYLVDGDAEQRASVAAEIAREHGGDGFFGIVPWDELHVVLAAELSEHLGLGWNDRDVIRRFRDKYAMKSWLREHSDVRINKSRRVSSAAEAEEFQEEVGGWPIVVKPTEAAGAMSVYFARDPGELLHACQQVLRFGRGSGMGEVLLEEFVDGREFAVNGLVDAGGDFLPTDVWVYDKRESHGIPNLYYQSIKLGRGDLFRSLASYASGVVSGLGLRRSPVHLELKVDDDGPCLIEVGARMAGGDQPVLASKLHGRSLFELAACHYLDELPLRVGDVSYERYDGLEARILSGIQPRTIPRVNAVLGLDRIRELPSFEDVGFLYPPGASVPVTRDLDTKSWEVYLLHPDGAQVEADARAVRTLLRYV